ncbi:MAG: hypothetical protein F4204_05620 [Rhodospirillaceae bacterium]|nr:hypothetical protein [Rhodospirillaceae bacterium]
MRDGGHRSAVLCRFAGRKAKREPRRAPALPRFGSRGRARRPVRPRRAPRPRPVPPSRRCGCRPCGRI